MLFLSSFEYHIFYVLYPFVTYLLTLSLTSTTCLKSHTISFTQKYRSRDCFNSVQPVFIVLAESRAIAQSLASHRGGPDSSPGLVMWDLWWTKWRCGRFSPSTSVSPANLYSTNCSTITLIYHLGLVQ
jgi:hypothetical protein